MKYGKTDVVVCDSNKDLGKCAGKAVASKMRELLKTEPEILAIFAAGESQMTFLDALAIEPGIEWNRVVCFNMDDFWEPKMPTEFSCVHAAHKQLYDKVKPKRIDYPRCNAPDAHVEAKRFAEALRKAGPVHIMCMGIGTSGHLALNEPGDTDLRDPETVRVVNVAEQSKKQLRIDPNFAGLGYVPDKGITMSIPALMNSKNIFTMVPLALKRPILTKVFATRSATAHLPASILLEHPGTLFVDADSCPPGHGLS